MNAPGFGDLRAAVQERAESVLDQLDLAVVEAHPLGRGGGERLPGDAVVGALGLAEVVQQRGHHQHVRPGDPPDQAGRLGAGLHQVPVNGEAVHH